MKYTIYNIWCCYFGFLVWLNLRRGGSWWQLVCSLVMSSHYHTGVTTMSRDHRQCGLSPPAPQSLRQREPLTLPTWRHHLQPVNQLNPSNILFSCGLVRIQSPQVFLIVEIADKNHLSSVEGLKTMRNISDDFFSNMPIICSVLISW